MQSTAKAPANPCSSVLTEISQQQWSTPSCQWQMNPTRVCTTGWQQRMRVKSMELWSQTAAAALLGHFSRVWLCVTPETAAHQSPPSPGLSRQEHWSGLPFPSPGARLPGLKSQLHHSLVVWLWINCPTSLYFSLLICKMEIIVNIYPILLL